MPQVQVVRTINAPPAIVFDAVTNLEQLPETNPAIVGVKFLSEQKSGVGTRFIETRRHGKGEMETELEVIEFRPPEHARMVADSHGTVWDTTFTITPEGQGTRLTLTMDAKGHKLLARAMNVVFKGLFRKGLATHVDAVQTYCEKKTQSP